MPIGSGQGFIGIDIELWQYMWASIAAIVGLLGIGSDDMNRWIIVRGSR